MRMINAGESLAIQNGIIMANNAQGSTADQQGIMMTTQQLDQILKLIPQSNSMSQKESETDEEIDYGFSGTVSSSMNKKMELEWIIDSGASDHMTSSLNNLINVKSAPTMFTINLSTGATAHMTHIGDAVLPNGLKLVNVLYVPQLNHNLLSIHKLAQDSRCDVMFRPNDFVIIDSKSKKVMGKGELRQGLYYLKYEKLVTLGTAMTGQKGKEVQNTEIKGKKEGSLNQFNVWYHSRMTWVCLLAFLLAIHMHLHHLS